MVRYATLLMLQSIRLCDNEGMLPHHPSERHRKGILVLHQENGPSRPIWLLLRVGTLTNAMSMPGRIA
jgi:hypothetical protein